MDFSFSFLQPALNFARRKTPLCVSLLLKSSGSFDFYRLYLSQAFKGPSFVFFNRPGQGRWHLHRPPISRLFQHHALWPCIFHTPS